MVKTATCLPSFRISSWLLFALLLPFVCPAQLRLASVFSDNMVLQRDKPVCIWGTGIPGSNIRVRFAGEELNTVVAADSAWRVYGKKRKPGNRSYTLSVSSGKEVLVLENILIGDVWIVSGQSNMEWPMVREMHWKAEAGKIASPLIRFNNPPPAGRYVYGTVYTDSLRRRLTPDSFYLWNRWQVCDSSTARNMSAVAYYFARTIVDAKNIPIGVINLSIGGAPIETFIRAGTLRDDARFNAKVSGNWLENTALPQWIRQRGKENIGVFTDTSGDLTGPGHAYKPGFAYEGGIQPLRLFPIKGLIWYQGESNSLEAERAGEYPDLMRLLISDYRKEWKDPRMPVYWVQLSSIDTPYYQSQFWPLFRDGQRKLLMETTNTGMAVSSDIGLASNVHPTNKKAVGERLARWALKQEYGLPLVPSGPLPVNAVYRNGGVVLTFQYAEKLRASDGTALHGFSLDGKKEAEAFIRGNTVVIPCAEKPVQVYYGWKPFSDGNLVNGENLPASTFLLQVK
ncbi:sialate O-acetylesterase [Sediminibacterium sp. WSJ-3]|nr:sialate O-acetylesterase [Sediminibacterium soli]